MEKHSFKSLCWNVNENCDVELRLIAPAINLTMAGMASLFVLFTRSVSPSGSYGTRVYSHGTAGFTEQQIAFTHAQSAIL